MIGADMYRGFAALLVSLLLVCEGSFDTARAAGATMEWADIAARAVPAVVNIEVSKVPSEGTDTDTDTDAQAGSNKSSEFFGSGFIVDPTGVVVTNKHVISDATTITVVLADGTQTRATVLAQGALVDLAFLKIDVGHALPTLKLGDGDAARPGDPVLAIGDPLGVGTSLSAGIVSGIQRNLMNSPFDDYVQTDAATNHGNSVGSCAATTA